MKNKFYKYLANVSGTTTFEYAFIIGVVGLALIAGSAYFSDGFNQVQDVIGGYMHRNIG